MYGLVLTLAMMGTLATGDFAPGEEFAGARAIAMAYATRSIATSNDAIFLNPAGMAMLQRYNIDINYMHRFEKNVAFPAVSLVDSQSSSLAMGLGYSWERAIDKSFSNHHAYLAAAYQIFRMLSLGITLKYMYGGGELLDFHHFTGDVGLMFNPIAGLRIGLIGYNLIDVGDGDEYLPIMLGAGIGYQGESFAAGFDFVANFYDKEDAKLRFSVGGEYTFAHMIPLRVGYMWDEDDDIHRWSIGTGVLFSFGALDIGFRQNAQNTKDCELVAAFRFFL